MQEPNFFAYKIALRANEIIKYWFSNILNNKCEKDIRLNFKRHNAQSSREELIKSDGICLIDILLLDYFELPSSSMFFLVFLLPICNFRSVNRDCISHKVIRKHYHFKKTDGPLVWVLFGEHWSSLLLKLFEAFAKHGPTRL